MEIIALNAFSNLILARVFSATSSSSCLEEVAESIVVVESESKTVPL